jgi:hypothetical protein
MAPRLLKPDFDGFDDLDTGIGFYDGPPPKPGTYRGRIKQMHIAKIESEASENKGKQRVDLVVEITSKGNGEKTPFAGAGLVHSLNVTKQGAPFLNQFLHALTDGSDEEKVAVREAWWRKGYKVGDLVQVRGKPMLPVLQFGKYKPQEQELTCAFVTRMGTIKAGENKGQERAEIARFVLPLNGSEAEEDDDSDSGLDEFDQETTSNPEPVKAAAAPAAEPPDDDDPWA